MQTFGHTHPTTTRGNVPMMQLRGVLTHAAEARTRLLDNTGLAVLCLDVELECSLHNVMHVEQLYEPTEHELVKARARALKKGDTVDVLVPLIDVRLVARNATQITLIAAAKAAPSTPTPNPQEPELWPA